MTLTPVVKRSWSWVSAWVTELSGAIWAVLWLATIALGSAAVVYGIYQMHRPTAWIIGGLIFFIARCGGIGPMVKFTLKMTERER